MAACHGLYACQQFLHGKRLRQIIVCAGIQPGHTVIDLSFGCEQQDRHGGEYFLDFRNVPEAESKEILDSILQKITEE